MYGLYVKLECTDCEYKLAWVATLACENQNLGKPWCVHVWKLACMVGPKSMYIPFVG